jgi:phosphoglycerate dehydrogenase-like enzyme
LDILLLESLIPEAMAWLQARHTLAYKPALVDDERGLRHSTDHARAIVVPSQVVINQDFLDFAPKLQVVARMQSGTDNINLEACQARNVKVLQARSANVRAHVEFLIGSLLMLYRRPVLHTLTRQPDAAETLSSLRESGREINGSTIGLLGIGPAAHALASMLHHMGARLVGYDPALHHSSPLWQQMRVQSVSLLDMLSSCDAVSVQMLYASRYRGFINERLLAACKPQQVWVSISRSALFDTPAMAAALQDGRIAAWLTDSSDEAFDQALPLLRSLPNFYATLRTGSMTREARTRVSWYLAHRLHDVLSPEDALHSGTGGLNSDLSPLAGAEGAMNHTAAHSPHAWSDSAPQSSLPPSDLLLPADDKNRAKPA